MSSGIYEIRNMVNGHRYIGSAVSLTHRKAQHLHMLRRGNHRNKHLQSAFNLYGEVNFIFTALYECSKEELIRCEQEELDLLKPEYNKCKIAGSTYGIKLSEETRKKLSIANRGRKHTEEHKRKIGLAGLGRVFSEEHKRKIGEANKIALTGRVHGPHSEEAIKKMSESQLGEKNHMYGKHHTEETKDKISLANKGKSMPDEVKIKISIANKGTCMGENNHNYGKRFSEETRRKMSDAQRARLQKERDVKNNNNAFTDNS